MYLTFPGYSFSARSFGNIVHPQAVLNKTIPVQSIHSGFMRSPINLCPSLQRTGKIDLSQFVFLESVLGHSAGADSVQHFGIFCSPNINCMFQELLKTGFRGCVSFRFVVHSTQSIHGLERVFMCSTKNSCMPRHCYSICPSRLVVLFQRFEAFSEQEMGAVGVSKSFFDHCIESIFRLLVSL